MTDGEIRILFVLLLLVQVIACVQHVRLRRSTERHVRRLYSWCAGLDHRTQHLATYRDTLEDDECRNP